MVGKTVESQKEKILAKLHQAGSAGLTKAGLGVTDTKGRPAQALRELLSERRVANLGTLKRTCFVLSEHFNPLERACERVEKNALSKKSSRNDTLELLIKKELEKGCEGEIRKKVDEAVEWLVKEARLLKLRRSRSYYFIHPGNLNEILKPRKPELDDVAETRQPPAPAEMISVIDRLQVLAAYHRLKSRLGYSNVEISELRRELNISMSELKNFLLEESSRGDAVLSLGDWSVSSDEIRSGAIELFGKPHLLVRFDAE